MPSSTQSSYFNSLNKPVFFGASLIILALLAFSTWRLDLAADMFGSLQANIIANGSWFYVLSVAVILLFVIYLGVSKYGSIRLGPEHSSPDYSLGTWISMLFAAGMGIGLMFFGVAEPLKQFLAPPTAEPQTLEAAREAMKVTFFHWGMHAWAIYAIVALVLAYFGYRHKLPLTLRSALYPLIGDKIYRWPGHLVDIFAVIGTTFGVATSLGLGAAQVNAGLSYLFGLEVSTGHQITIMAVITGLAAVSVGTGLDKGIRRLSEANMVMAITLLVLIFVLGPSVFLLQAYVQNVGTYLSDIVRITFNLFAYEKSDWIGGWTIFYWGWWLAWAPFVGMFIARISRGRTIREFVMGVLLIPTAFTLLWMTVFGNSAIALVNEAGAAELEQMVISNTPVALFVFLEQFPWSQLLSLLAVLMIVVFFVTSCDSGAMIIDMLCSHGRNDTPLWQRLFWAIAVGVVAAVLLFAGGLSALQTMTIASALPFTVILLIALVGLMNALNVELAKQESLQMNVAPSSPPQSQEDWEDRLQNIIEFPSRSNVNKFIHRIVKPGLEELAKKFEENNLSTELKVVDYGVRLTVHHGDEQNFAYGVYRKKHQQPDFSLSEEENDDDDEHHYYRAEVHLIEGGQDYDIMGWSKKAVINDVIDQYQKHLHFLHLLR
ncbi:BCCT family transporter [Paraferrimonas sedimenticola]|uniref:Choline transporter n=1 Tax=Paraferrimonas sedimenticola TaxID=375674 RepID=A0AA37RYQ1_9GAMM|nr:choline BCCT transporter BetT [Paraferrimonas sedimenticola]GLP97643.1 choline transporter [Paraferrimonas sedimenticola]